MNTTSPIDYNFLPVTYNAFAFANTTDNLRKQYANFYNTTRLSQLCGLV
jgi:hypothetical protein